MKVISVIGTRPEAIKMAPVIKELERYPGEIQSVVCATAQHREMLDQVLDLFEIRPDYDLNLMRPNQTLAQVTARVLTGLDPVIREERPAWLLAQGDTTTVMAASMIAYYHRVRVGHVEAGLRTDDKYQPFPEEVNRRIADVLADLHFAPTPTNRRNLLREGIPAESVVVTGNTVIDALLDVARRVSPATVPPWGNLNGRRVILVTAHRRENFGRPLDNICAALAQIARDYAGDVHLVYPVHPNPNVQGPVYAALGDVPGITLIDPLDYQDLVALMKQACLVLTDSGGLQEEAPGLGKPVLVMRAVTERPEGLDAGTVKLVGTDRERIVEETRRLLDDPAAYEGMARAVNPYGDGRAAARIVHALRLQAGLTDVPVTPFRA